MKSYLFKINLSLLLLTVASFSFAQTSDEIVFKEAVHKFKKVDEGPVLTFNYTFNYHGEFPLSIIPPQVDCSCTKVILPEKNILPNTTNVITIEFDTKNKIGYQEREVVIQFVSDAMDSRSIDKKLIFKGVVKASQETKDAYKLHQKNN